jgi:arylsulfatase A-like enzyme
MRKHSILSTGMLWMLSVLLYCCSFKQTNNENGLQHPNVILILTDDQGWGDLGIHGNPGLCTPAIDAMAENSAHFQRFYVSPLCAPTRASLLTGRYHLRTGTSWVSKGKENMNPREVTIAEIFRDAGYSTGCFGKWHNGAHFPQHPNQQGFDEFVGFCAGHWNNYFSTTLQHNGKPFPTDGYITDVLANQAIGFIEENQERAFFCYIPFNTPHGPFQVADRYFDKYKAMGYNDKDAAVYGMCENIDDNVAKIITRVQELGIADNTIIIFMTDNGPNGNRFNGGMRGIKGSIHEGGVRVPCVISWKGTIEPRKVTEIAAHIDILPTLVKLCNLEPPETMPLDGLDISPLLLEQSGMLPERLLFSKKSSEDIIPDGAVRSDRHRLVIEKGDTMLFDMQKDPGQSKNIARSEKSLTSSLAYAYNEWFQEVRSDHLSVPEIKIGYVTEESAYLPAHEASFSGDIHFMEGHGWAHDWLVNWVNDDDSIYWDVIVNETTIFEIELLYSCAEDDIGSILQVSIARNMAESRLTSPHDPEYLPSPDRVPRIEVYEKHWASLPLGRLEFPAGNQTLVLKTTKIAGAELGEIKGLRLSRQVP